MMMMTTTSLVSIRLDTLFYRTINHTNTDRMSQFWLESDMWMWRYHFLKIYHPLFQPKPLHFQWPSPYSVNITLTIISFCLPLLYTIGYWSCMGKSAANTDWQMNFWCCDHCNMVVLRWVIVVFDGLSRHLEGHGQCQTSPLNQWRQLYVVDLRLVEVSLSYSFIFVYTAVAIQSFTFHALLTGTKPHSLMGPTTHFVCGLILFYFVAVGCLLLVENKGVLNKMNFGKWPVLHGRIMMDSVGSTG